MPSTESASVCEHSSVQQGSPLVDDFHRPVEYVRLAVTTACNLRCSYCMREEHTNHTATKGAELTRHEIMTIVKVLADHGVTKIRFTGGEPLLRTDIVDLVRDAKQQSGITTVGLTTNGLLLDRFLPELEDAGLDSINFSIDTLHRERYKIITRRDEYNRARTNLEMLLDSSTIVLKLNVVMMREINSDELCDFVDLTREHLLTVRFMELQPFDDHQIWRTGRFLGAEKIETLLKGAYKELQACSGRATQHFSYTLPGHKGMIAIIPAYTRNFCSQCNKIRITSTGKIISCLYEKEGLELRPLLHGNASHAAIAKLFSTAVSRKPENGRYVSKVSARTSMSEIGG